MKCDAHTLNTEKEMLSYWRSCVPGPGRTTLFLLYFVRNDNNKDDQSITKIYQITNDYWNSWIYIIWTIFRNLIITTASMHARGC